MIKSFIGNNSKYSQYYHVDFKKHQGMYWIKMNTETLELE